MEKIFVVIIVFTSIGLLIWSIISAPKGKGRCWNCGSHGECKKNKEINDG